MKIDGNRSNLDLDQTKSTEAAQKAAAERLAKKADLPGGAGKILSHCSGVSSPG
jgi:hypothetical protein